MPELPKIDIRPDHWEIVRGILQKRVPQYAVWAFGSRAKWTAKQYSDLDLAVITDKPLSLNISANLSDDFSESDLPWRVDVVDWATTSESFRKMIERDKVVVQEGGRGWGMGSDHPVVRLGNYVDACLGKMLDAQKNRGELHPYLGNSNVRWGSFDLEELSAMRFKDHEDERYGIRDGDLIVCEGGEPGRCAIWRGNASMRIQKALHRIRTKARLDNYFLYYWFLRAGSTGELEPFFTGTTIKHLTGKALAELRVPLPPIEVQREVARVLKSIDDKIDVNRRINQTLEAMAQATFKSWFVDFDPVKAKIAAKAEGRDPLRAAMSAISGKPEAELNALPPEALAQLAVTAALFPDEMEESELGEIPKGWSSAALSGVADVVMGQSPDGETYNDIGNGMPLINGPVEFDLHHPKRIKWTTQPTKACQNGDLIVCVRGSTTGKFVKSDGVYCLGRGVCAIRAHEPRQQPFVDQVYKFSLSNLLLLATGSTFPNWSGPTLKNHRILKPAADVIEAYSQLVLPALSQISSNEGHTKSLQILRDTLLPKLLSGELSVAEAMAEGQV